VTKEVRRRVRGVQRVQARKARDAAQPGSPRRMRTEARTGEPESNTHSRGAATWPVAPTFRRTAPQQRRSRIPPELRALIRAAGARERRLCRAVEHAKLACRRRDPRRASRAGRRAASPTRVRGPAPPACPEPPRTSALPAYARRLWTAEMGVLRSSCRTSSSRMARRSGRRTRARFAALDRLADVETASRGSR